MMETSYSENVNEMKMVTLKLVGMVGLGWHGWVACWCFHSVLYMQDDEKHKQEKVIIFYWQPWKVQSNLCEGWEMKLPSYHHYVNIGKLYVNRLLWAFVRFTTHSINFKQNIKDQMKGKRCEASSNVKGDRRINLSRKEFPSFHIFLFVILFCL